jgi:hypothetical protein
MSFRAANLARNAQRRAKAARAKEDDDNRPRYHGVCLTCGCTDRAGCPEGCEWADDLHTLCTSCKPLSPAETAQKRREAIAELEMERGHWAEQLQSCADAVTLLTLRIAAVHAAQRLTPARRAGGEL